MLDDPVCHLTTTGRVTGRPHRIEIWFATEDDQTLFLLAGGGRSSDWVLNVEADPDVEAEVGGERHGGRARLLEPGTEEDGRARRLLVAKYGSSGDDLSGWGASALAVAVDLDPIGG